jgi:hypothetical protein
MRLIRLVIVLLLATPAVSAKAGNPCGTSPDDWCTKPSDGICGTHLNEADCRADKRCVAVRYSGESVVACQWDARGFAGNCPAVGCRAQ